MARATGYVDPSALSVASATTVAGGSTRRVDGLTPIIEGPTRRFQWSKHGIAYVFLRAQ
jgi:hypothetical protein